MRAHLSKGLGFSKADRDINIRRIGFVASEIVFAMEASPSVLRSALTALSAMKSEISSEWISLLKASSTHRSTSVLSATPRECTPKRKRGEIPNFTGVDDPYESPEHPEIKLDSEHNEPEANSLLILDYLIQRGFPGKSQSLRVDY